MGISKRLKYIAGLVTAGNTVADIGTDHGYVPVFLVKNNISPRAIAIDVSAASLEKAKELAERAGISQLIDCRISDGFENLAPGEVDSVIISGMGGILISSIIESHPDVLKSLKEIILSPHRDADLVRSVLEDHNFRIVSDEIIEDKGKDYVIIKAYPK